MSKQNIKTSESVTENIFRDFYKNESFIEKSAIPKEYGFKSKKGTGSDGYPDFFCDLNDYCVVVEAKAMKHSEAESEVKFYMLNNTIYSDIIGIAISGQTLEQIKVTYFYKLANSQEITPLKVKDSLLKLESLHKKFLKHKYGEVISEDELINVIKSLNETFHRGNIRETERSLFFSGLMIALTNANFRNTYKNISTPSKAEISKTSITLLQAHHLNKAIIEAIEVQLESKINNLSKEYSWGDKFSFIRNIDFSLIEYKEIIKKIENKIYKSYLLDEKQDILGKAYKIFLSRAGSAESKNIILTPDHIKGLMIKLARLNVNDVVIDTCMGTGGFLMEAMEKLINLSQENEEKISNIKEKQLIGFEIDSVLFSLSCSNMFLHGDGRSNLLFRSSLLDNNTQIANNYDSILFDYIKTLKPTKCIINPPYEKNQSIKFTWQALNFLEQNGKLIIIMPTPTLSKNKNGLLVDILKIAKLDFVIKMPLNLFSEQKRIVNTSIFGFTKTPHDENDDVIFYNLSDDGFVSVQHKGRLDKNNLWNDTENSILDHISNTKELSGICERRKIYNDGVLNPSGYQSKRNSDYKLISISELFDIIDGSLASEKSNNDGEYDFITASEEWKKHDNFTHDCEAIIYAAKAGGSLGRTHYVNGKFISSNLCYILISKNNREYPINVEFYNYYLSAIREQIVSDLADGTSKLTIDKEALKDYLIEYIPLHIQDEYVRKHVDRYKKVIEELNNVKDSMTNDLLLIL
ncbi:N-6 DNA methylase [Pasteurella multocida]|uniref:N-6 DNA methylase n=1 Tax=Pasteurella multocida TaxID=747 RepID=UPI001118E66B|nr:N-6 DNA methylase [Pasteurella multocida]MDY0632153.1 N-6 DNA methylase [Pasteurella multocida]QDA12088.1 restriction endonuclease [Pasteurella multocida subsp. multocida]